MAEVHYLISDASKQVDVESHVLRYWEDELGLDIPRNDMGHRYYTEYHIRLFRKIKELKEKGYQLKAIKNALNKMTGAMEEITITEDYMEEDMKAAWNEGPSRERPKARTAEMSREQLKAKPGETSQKQVKARPAENVSEQGKTRTAEEVREQLKARLSEHAVEGTGDQIKSRIPEAGKQPAGRQAEGGTSQLGAERTESAREPSKISDQEKKEGTEKEAPVSGGKNKASVMTIENLQRNSRKSEETSLKEIDGGQTKPQTAQMNAEKMARFQSVMNHIIGRAMDANMDRLAREVSNTVSEDVTDKVMKEVEYLMRVSDEKEEERFRQLDETIRAYQKQGKGRAEAAAAKVPFFRKKKFGKSGKKLF